VIFVLATVVVGLAFWVEFRYRASEMEEGRTR